VRPEKEGARERFKPRPFGALAGTRGHVRYGISLLTTGKKGAELGEIQDIEVTLLTRKSY